MFKKIIILSFMFGSIFMLSPIQAQAADLACTIETPNGDIIDGTWINGVCQPNVTVAVAIDAKVHVNSVSFFERIKLFFTFNQGKKADMLQDFSNRNFEFAKQELLTGNTEQAKILFEKSGKDIMKAEVAIAQIKDEEKKQEAQSSLSATASNRTIVLTAVQAKVESTTAKAAIGDALIKQAEVRATIDAKTEVKEESEQKENPSGVNVSGSLGVSVKRPVEESSCFVSPQAGETWPFGSTNTIKLANPPVYNEHCSNTFSLVSASTNQRVAYLGVQSVEGQSSYLWTAGDTLLSFSCGSSGDQSPAVVSPGQYKIRFEEQDTVSGTGQPISCESGIITLD